MGSVDLDWHRAAAVHAYETSGVDAVTVGTSAAVDTYINTLWGQIYNDHGEPIYFFTPELGWVRGG